MGARPTQPNSLDLVNWAALDSDQYGLAGRTDPNTCHDSNS
jgi:hypothetical protein